MNSRKAWTLAAAGVIAILAAAGLAFGPSILGDEATSEESLGTEYAEVLASAPKVRVFKTPNCGCCSMWVAHMRAAGFEVEPIDVESSELTAIKGRQGVDQELASCHTALIGDYVVEGHVPAEDVARLLKERPDVRGLAVPGMPAGSPGMEMPGGEKESYDVVAFDSQGEIEVFAKH